MLHIIYLSPIKKVTHVYMYMYIYTKMSIKYMTTCYVMENKVLGQKPPVSVITSLDYQMCGNTR